MSNGKDFLEVVSIAQAVVDMHEMNVMSLDIDSIHINDIWEPEDENTI